MSLTEKSYIMIVLFHDDYYQHIIECNNAQMKINVIEDFSHLLYEKVKIKHFHFINNSDEIFESKIVLISK